MKGNIETGILGAINDQIAPLQKKVQSFVVNADSLLKSLNEIMDPGTKTNLRAAVVHLNHTLASFETTSKSLNKLMAENGKVDNMVTGANNAVTNLTQFTDSLNNLRLAETVASLESAMNNLNAVLADVEKGNGTLGKLLKDEGLYDNLEGASKEMEELLRDLKLNPKRFVHFSLFGKKAKPYEATIDSVE